MKKVRELAQAIRGFMDEVVTELKKCAWPTRPELVESTVMVIVASLILGMFVGASDFGLIKLLQAVIR